RDGARLLDAALVPGLVRAVRELRDRKECQPPVAALEQVSRRQPAPELVVDRYNVAPPLVAAQEDGGDVVLVRLAHGPRIAREREEHDASHALREQHLDAGELARAVALGVA